MENRRQPGGAGPTTAWCGRTVDKLMNSSGHLPGIGTIHDPRKMIGEVCCLMVAFLGTPSMVVAAIIIAAFATLRARDLTYHPKATAIEAATDALVTASAIVLSQIYLAFRYPNFATLQVSELAHGTGLALLLIAAWRLFFHLHTLITDPEQLAELRMFRTAFRISVMLALAAWFVGGSNAIAVPIGHFETKVLAWAMTLAMILSCKLQMKSGRLFASETDGAATVFTDQAGQAIENRAGVLPLRGLKRFWRNGAVGFCRTVFVCTVMFPMFIAVWRLFFGDATGIHWAQLGANIAAMAALFPLWRVITAFNAAAVTQMHRTLIARKGV